MTQPIRAAGSSPDAVARPEGTFRAYAIGVALAALFAACNVYLGLKIGVIANLSIPATLLAFGALRSANLATRGAIRDLGILENNLVQAAASAGGSVASAGLISSVPAMIILTGTQFSWPTLTLWITVISGLGVSIAMLVRRPLIESDGLVFAPGVACATTLQHLHARERGASGQSALLVGAIVFATILTYFTAAPGGVPAAGPWHLPAPSLTFALAGGVIAASVGWKLAIEPLYFAIGGLVGIRVGLSMLIGAVIAHGAIAPWLVQQGITEQRLRGDWLSWPASTLIVVGSLFGLLSASAAIRRSFRQTSTSTSNSSGETAFALGWVGAASLIAIAVQVFALGISPLLAVVATLLAVPLAMIAGRVAGETSLTPSGPVSKLSQIAVGLLPQAPTQASLLSANIAGGAAAQCADLLHDLKCGAILGANWRYQAISQFLGACAGAAAGSALLLFRFPNPAAELVPPNFQAAALVGVKRTAEFLMSGKAAIPDSAWPAVEIAAVATLVLLAAESLLPSRWRQFVPSTVSIGFAFILPPAATLAIACGAVLFGAVRGARPTSANSLIIVCSGIVVGAVLFELGYDAVKVLWR